MIKAAAVAAAALLASSASAFVAPLRNTPPPPPPPVTVGGCCSDLSGSSQYQYGWIATQTEADGSDALQQLVFTQVDMAKQVQYQQVNLTQATNGTGIQVNQWIFQESPNNFVQVTSLFNDFEAGCWTQPVANPNLTQGPCFGGAVGPQIFSASALTQVYSNSSASSNGYYQQVTVDKCIPLAMSWTWVDDDGTTQTFGQANYFNQFNFFASPIPANPDPSTCQASASFPKRAALKQAETINSLHSFSPARA